MLGSLGLPELLVIAFICVLVFGPKAVPRLMGMVGEGVRSLRSAMKDDNEAQ